MEILEILKNNGKELYPEDLDLLETELATGSYSAAYQSQCRRMIHQLRNWLKEPDSEKASADDPGEMPRVLTVGLDQLAPASANPAASNMTPEERLFREVRQMRDEDAYKSRFKKYIAGQAMVDEAFLEKHFSFFAEWELNAIVSVKPLNEAFLEKYFGALDRDKIARYQLFSEGFFMKHFAQMDANVVLKHGKNEWRKKEKRSKQLDVFLRLKGVNL